MTYGEVTYDQVHSVAQASTSCYYMLHIECSYVSFGQCGWKDYNGNMTAFKYTKGTIEGLF